MAGWPLPENRHLIKHQGTFWAHNVLLCRWYTDGRFISVVYSGVLFGGLQPWQQCSFITVLREGPWTCLFLEEWLGMLVEALPLCLPLITLGDHQAQEVIPTDVCSWVLGCVIWPHIIPRFKDSEELLWFWDKPWAGIKGLAYPVVYKRPVLLFSKMDLELVNLPAQEWWYMLVIPATWGA
jgi:hypothetical protein